MQLRGPVSVLDVLADVASALRLRASCAMPVQRREPSHHRGLTLAWNVAGEKLGELLQPQRLGARAQQKVQEVQILDALRQLKAELRVAELHLSGPFLELHPALIQPQRFCSDLAVAGTGFVIVEIGYLSAQVGFFLVE